MKFRAPFVREEFLLKTSVATFIEPSLCIDLRINMRIYSCVKILRVLWLWLRRTGANVSETIEIFWKKIQFQLDRKTYSNSLVLLGTNIPDNMTHWRRAKQTQHNNEWSILSELCIILLLTLWYSLLPIIWSLIKYVTNLSQYIHVAAATAYQHYVYIIICFLLLHI